MKHKLLILTGKYPYSNGETFLVNELKYIPDNFEKIYIYPVLIYEKKNKLKWKYEKPGNNNIDIVLGSSFKSLRGIVSSFGQTIISSDFWLEVKRLLQKRSISASTIYTLILYAMRSHYAATIAINKIVKELSNGEDLSIYSYWMDYDAYTAVLIKRKAKGKIRRVITRCHRGDLYESAARGGFLPMRKAIFDSMDAIYSISSNGIEYLKKTYPDIIRNNLEISRLGTFDYGCSVLEKEPILRLVSCSWVRPVKRVHLIPKALENIDVDVEWTHMGDGSAMKLLQEAVGKLNNPHVKCCLLGECRNEKVMQLYASEKYHVFVNVSENEGVPVSIMEAMSFGMIIIATNVGGVDELIVNGENGYLLDKDFKTIELTGYIRRISQMSSETLRKMSLKSREIWEKNYSAERNYRAFYKALIDEKQV